MKLLDNFKDSKLARKLLQTTSSFKKPVSFMEVCGTHTVAIFKTGIRTAIPNNINLISGPGCPVCVTHPDIIEKAIGLALRKDTILFCFGDMIRVPGSSGSLETAKADKGARIKIMYGPLEALEWAKKKPNQTVILLGVGFETTIPLFAALLLRAKKEKIKNLYLLSAFKVIPPAIEALLSSKEVKLNGFILPGHVSTIIGEQAYEFMAKKYKVAGVITGFEIVDLLSGINCLLDMVNTEKIAIKNQYSRFVSKQGNRKAQTAIYRVFKPNAANWRGLGIIPHSGLTLNNDFCEFEAEKLIDFEIKKTTEPKGCKCTEVIKGICKPTDCKLYKIKCTPLKPVGPCMVSGEGTCAAYYKYGEN